MVKPVLCMCPGSPKPNVPTTVQRCPRRLKACASHQAVDVLPLVPVTACKLKAALGESKYASAMAPLAAFKPA